jgi:WD40 repeat protein
MTTASSRWFAMLVLPLLLVPIFAAAAEDAEIARLVKQLGHDDFDKREEASRRLAKIGDPALEALQKATSSDDTEVRRRAKDIVALIEKTFNVEELRLTGHTHKVWSVSLSADGKRLLTSGDDKTLRLWDTDTGKQLRVFEGHTAATSGVAALSPDGKRVLSGSLVWNVVRLLDTTTGKELRTLEGHTGAVLSVAFGPEGQAISGSIDGTMRLWDLRGNLKRRVNE